MRPHRPVQSPGQEQRAKKRAVRRRKKIIRIALIVAVAVGFFVFICRLSVFRIRAIETEGNQLVQTDALIETTWNQLKGNYLLIIPNNNIFFLRQRRLQKTLTESFPRIADLNIERGNLRTLHLVVSERPHAFVWCADVSMVDCYFADDNGLLFAKAPYFSSSVFLTFFGGDITDNNKIDAHIISDPAEFKRLVAMVHALTDTGFSITTIRIGSRMDYTMTVSYIRDTKTSNADIVVTTTVDQDIVLRNIKLAMDSDDFKESFLAYPETLDYIDARLPEKVFYKFGK